jgi:hypothetical protein
MLHTKLVDYIKSIKCNIDKSDRINRTVIGIALCLGALLNFGAFSCFLLGVILIVEGLVGWCSIPILMEKFKTNMKKDK